MEFFQLFLHICSLNANATFSSLSYAEKNSHWGCKHFNYVQRMLWVIVILEIRDPQKSLSLYYHAIWKFPVHSPDASYTAKCVTLTFRLLCENA